MAADEDQVFDASVCRCVIWVAVQVHNNNIFKNIYTCRTKVIFNVKQGKKIVFRDTSCLAGVSSSYNGLRFTDRQLIAAGQIRKGSL